MESRVTDESESPTSSLQMSSPWPAGTGVSRSELNPVSFLYRSAALHPERVAVVHGDRRYTYAELGERVNRLASALRSHGLEPHDRVAALCPNVPALLELHHGVPAAGGVLVAINTRLSASEIRHILEHSGARMLFVDAELESLVADPPAGVEISPGRRRRPEHRPLRAAAREGRSRWRPVASAGRGGADRDRLHVRHDRQAKGGRVHVPRRLPERARRGHRGGAWASPGLSCGRCRCSTATAGASRGP